MPIRKKISSPSDFSTKPEGIRIMIEEYWNQTKIEDCRNNEYVEARIQHSEFITKSSINKAIKMYQEKGWGEITYKLDKENNEVVFKFYFKNKEDQVE